MKTEYNIDFDAHALLGCRRRYYYHCGVPTLCVADVSLLFGDARRAILLFSSSTGASDRGRSAALLEPAPCFTELS